MSELQAAAPRDGRWAVSMGFRASACLIAALASMGAFSGGCSDGGGRSGSMAGAGAQAGMGESGASGGAAGAGTAGMAPTAGAGEAGSAGMAGSAGISGGMAGGGISGGTGGDGPDGGDMGTPDGGMDDEIEYEDPGSAEWVPVPADQVEEVCKLDRALLAQADATLNIPYVVVRYGKLCHEFYPPGETPMTTSEVFSTTKTLGALVTGIAIYETRDLTRTGRKTGPLSDWDRVDHWLDNFSYNRDAHIAHVLGMVGHNASLALGAKQHAYDTTGDVQINSLSEVINTAIAQDAARLGADIEQFTQRFLFEPLGMTQSVWTGGMPSKVFGYTWNSRVREMARVGLLLLNRGMWNGQRVLDTEYVYKMTHPSFEDGNTAYGYLTWLSSWSNHSIGFSPPTGQGPNILGHSSGPCAPVALWQRYPHGELSTSPNCNYAPPYTCEQTHDVGVYQAVGLGGQLIQVHPGLDLVIAARNDVAGGAGLWPALIAAVAALDPEYPGDAAAFCAAYSAGEHAPDLRSPWPAYE